MMKRNFKPDQIACWARVLLLCGGCLLAGAAAAQEVKLPAAKPTVLGAKPAPPPPVEKGLQTIQKPAKSMPMPVTPMPVARPAGNSTVKVYPLKYADADSIEDVIVRLVLRGMEEFALRGEGEMVSMARDERTDSILLFAPPEVHKQVSELIEQLDVPLVSDPEEEIRVFSLHNTDPLSAAEILGTVLESSLVRIAVDQRAKSIIVSAPPEKLQIAEALLLQLDDPADKDLGKPDSSANFQVRVVWLASGLSGDEVAKPADDLEDVIDELSKVGVEGLRQVGQVLVNTTPNGRFEVRSSPALGESFTNWEVSGEFESRQGTPVLQIQLSATRLLRLGGPGGAEAGGESVEMQTLVALDTSISIVAPPGHFVVLGTAPVDKMTAVFVLQVTPNTKD